VDLPATFTGTLPCVVCPASSIELTLLPDSSYSLKRTVQGQAGRVEDESGSWSYSSDRIVLVLKSSNDRWSWFAVRGPNLLRAVDARGESIGLRAPADLQRAVAPAAVSPRANPAPAEPINAPLEGVAWKLDELENKPVRPASKTHREIVLTFDPEDGGFSGVSGCNQLSGTFEATWRTLTVTPTSPMRLCRVDDGTERALIRTFKATRAYRITGQVLEWLDERGARIARFELRTR
jgi:copper homeostasis protein (lipoprotein)